MTKQSLTTLAFAAAVLHGACAFQPHRSPLVVDSVVGVGRARVVLQGKGKRSKEFANLATGATPAKPTLGSTQTVPAADALVGQLFVECAEEKLRDVAEILSLCHSLAQVANDNGFVATKSKRLAGDWQLKYVSGDDALCAVGSGLHKMPLTRAEDLFLTLSADGDIETAEILRVIGPFPNVRNTLAGTFGAGKDGTTAIKYDSMIDGIGNQIKAPDGGQTRRVDVRIAYVNDDALVLLPVPEGASKATPVSELRDVLVFAREPDLDAQFIRLRVERA